MRTKKLSKFAEDILIIKSFNKIIIYCKVFHRKSMKVFKKTELHKENETTFFLCLLMQSLKNHVNSFIFFYKKNSSFSFISCYSEKSCTFCNKFSLKIHYSTSLEYFQTINHSLFILMKFTESHKFNNAFNSFNSEFISHNIIC